MKPKWKDLHEFILNKIKDEGESFLDNDLYIEMVSPDSSNSSYDIVEDGEGWKYASPCWIIGKKVNVLTTRFSTKKIVSLNINY